LLPATEIVAVRLATTTISLAIFAVGVIAKALAIPLKASVFESSIFAPGEALRSLICVTSLEVTLEMRKITFPLVLVTSEELRLGFCSEHRHHHTHAFEHKSAHSSEHR
jgi:hypothetical protein